MDSDRRKIALYALIVFISPALLLVLVAAGLASLSITWLLLFIAKGLQQYPLSILGTSLRLVLALFLIPALLIGIVTPLLTTLVLSHSQRTGHIVGMMHALGATGSIIGTFAAACCCFPGWCCYGPSGPDGARR